MFALRRCVAVSSVAPELYITKRLLILENQRILAIAELASVSCNLLFVGTLCLFLPRRYYLIRLNELKPRSSIWRPLLAEVSSDNA